MDNHFEKEFYGYEPQRPMTEKHEIPPSVQPALDIDEFEPQKPLMKGEIIDAKLFAPDASYADLNVWTSSLK